MRLVTLAALLCLSMIVNAADNRSNEAIEAAAQQLIDESQTEAGTDIVADMPAVEEGGRIAVPAAKKETKELKESEIPVFISDKKEAKSETTSFAWRLLASMGILAVVAGGMVYASKRWNFKKDKGGQKTRIEILHQLHMGPKKSLGLIRVAGEVILIGITDQNISMLKTIALIDDELEGALGGKDFNGFLDDEFEMQDVRTLTGPRA